MILPLEDPLYVVDLVKDEFLGEFLNLLAVAIVMRDAGIPAALSDEGVRFDLPALAVAIAPLGLEFDQGSSARLEHPVDLAHGLAHLA